MSFSSIVVDLSFSLGRRVFGLDKDEFRFEEDGDEKWTNKTREKKNENEAITHGHTKSKN